MMLIGLAALVGLIVLATRPTNVGSSKATPEWEQAGDLADGLRAAVDDPGFEKLVAANPEARGSEAWALLMRSGVMDSSLLRKCVSLNSTEDSRPDTEKFLAGEVMDDRWCSYTAPRLDQLADVLSRKGKDRVVVFTFNARNWNNYPGPGALILWSDGDVAEYMHFESAAEYWGITEEEWADPAGKLFGKKAPFQYTYE